MRSYRGALAVLAVTIVSLLVAGPAAAGGPTSVLLVAPGTGRTASLHTADADYQVLADLVGAFGPGDAGAADGSGTSHEQGAVVTLTWLVHDVQVWRVDRVYLDAPGGPWIATQTDAAGSGDLWEQPATWQKVARGKELAELLDRLGLRRGAPASRAGAGVADGTVGSTVGTTVGSTDGDAAASTSAGSAAPTATAGERRLSSGASTGTAAPGGTELGWGVAGLALGVALTLAAMRRRSGTAAPDPSRTADVADAGPGDPAVAAPDASDGSFERSSVEELSGPARPRT
jgi:hypothetical protein